MRNLAKIIMVAFVVLISVGVLIFTVENQNTVSIAFFGVDGPPLAVSILVITSFLLGMVFGPILVLLRRNLLKKSKIVKKW